MWCALARSLASFSSRVIRFNSTYSIVVEPLPPQPRWVLLLLCCALRGDHNDHTLNCVAHWNPFITDFPTRWQEQSKALYVITTHNHNQNFCPIHDHRFDWINFSYSLQDDGRLLKMAHCCLLTATTVHEQNMYGAIKRMRLKCAVMLPVSRPTTMTITSTTAAETKCR